MFCNSVNCGFGRKALGREIAQVFERNAAMNDDPLPEPLQRNGRASRHRSLV